MATATRTWPTATKSWKVNFDEFCALVDSDHKADLIDGVIYMASPENLEANDLFLWLCGLLYGFVEELNLGSVFGSRVACRFDDLNGPEPDILFVSKRRQQLLHKTSVRGAPDLAVEIVTPDSVDRDYDKKWKLYQRMRVREYWIIDPMRRKAVFLRLDRHGKYREVPLKRGVFHSAVVKGFWLRPEWLWQEPRPKKAAILKQLLAQGGVS